MQKLLFIFVLAAICTATSYSIRPAYSSYTYVKQKSSTVKNAGNKKAPKKTSLHNYIQYQSGYRLYKLHLPQLGYDQEDMNNTSNGILKPDIKKAENSNFYNE